MHHLDDDFGQLGEAVMATSIAKGDSASFRRRQSAQPDARRVSAAIATRALPSHQVPGRAIRVQARAWAALKSSRIGWNAEA